MPEFPGVEAPRDFPLGGTDAPPEAPRDCALCGRLVAYRAANRVTHPDWYNGAVESFGDPAARLLVVGLAPGVTGANRTGRPFTGDWAGDLLYPTLAKFGFSRGLFDARPDDGLQLIDAMITNAVRCVPPQNKPVGAEVNACRAYLAARIAALPGLTHIITLGKIAHDSTIRTLGRPATRHPFAHNAASRIGRYTVTSSYHCSRYNTNTGRLTAEMFEAVFAGVRAGLNG
jgi:uracil-DNA glycosylase family 4